MSNAFSITNNDMSKMIAMSNTNYNILLGIVNEVIGNGGPSGVFDTLQELNDRYPKGAKGVFLVTINGKWYYWSGTEWTAGGVYQAIHLSDGSVTDVKLEIGLREKIDSIEGIGVEAEKANTDITSHKNSLQAHNSQAITYSGSVIGAGNAKQAIDFIQDQLNRAIFSGDSSVAAKQAAIDAKGYDYKNLKLRLDTENTQLVSKLTDKVSQQDAITTVPMPVKQGVNTKSPKLVLLGDSDNAIDVIQYIGNKYSLTHLDIANGDTSSNSVAGKWDLIRIKKTQLVGDAYVAKTTYDVASVVGTVETTFAPGLRNTIENSLIYPFAFEDTTKFISSSGNGNGIGLYKLSNTTAVSEVTFKVRIDPGGKCNVVLWGSASASPDVDILVLGEVVKKLDTSKMTSGSNNHLKIIPIEVPSYANTNSVVVDVTLRNNDLTGKGLFFSCVNFMKLKDYDGRDVDFYKVFGTNKHWINHRGASDYAIFDKDLGKYMGSFHGGETRISAKITYPDNGIVYDRNAWSAGKYRLADVANVNAGWFLTPTFKIEQLTNLNNKGKMYSCFDFDTDGTLDMDFNFYDGSVTVKQFYTALTCGDINMTWLKLPKYEALPTPSNENISLKTNIGHVILRNNPDSLSLGIRFCKFQNRFNKSHDDRTGGYLYNGEQFYKKFYYGYADDYEPGVLVQNLQFQKALDFIFE